MVEFVKLGLDDLVFLEWVDMPASAVAQPETAQSDSSPTPSPFRTALPPIPRQAFFGGARPHGLASVTVVSNADVVVVESEADRGDEVPSSLTPLPVIPPIHKKQQSPPPSSRKPYFGSKFEWGEEGVINTIQEIEESENGRATGFNFNKK